MRPPPRATWPLTGGILHLNLSLGVAVRVGASGKQEIVLFPLATRSPEAAPCGFWATHSAIVDLPLTAVQEGTLLSVAAWYGNEMDDATRLGEAAARIAGQVATNGNRRVSGN